MSKLINDLVWFRSFRAKFVTRSQLSQRYARKFARVSRRIQRNSRRRKRKVPGSLERLRQRGNSSKSLRARLPGKAGVVRVTLELLALKRTLGELGSIGRNLNQIAHAANQGQLVTSPGRNDLETMLRVCGTLRDSLKRVLLANLKSWEQGAP